MPILDLANVGFNAYSYVDDACCGAGKVYAAKKDGHRLACKMLQTEKLSDRCGFQHAMEEVQWLKLLRHTNIVQFHSAIVCDRHILIATHLSDMGSALNVINKYYPNGLPEVALVSITKQLSQALNYLHSQYILHRSIRASHVLLDSGGGVRLTGFKHCLRLNGHGLGPIRPINAFTEHLSDSLLWLAPEVISQHVSGYGLSSDIYSLGITICEMANGFPPFTDMTPLQMLFEKTRGTTPRLLDATTIGPQASSEHSRHRFSAGLHKLVAACLSINPDDRPSASHLMTSHFFKETKSAPASKKTEYLHSLLPLVQLISEGNNELTVVEDINDTKETTASCLNDSIVWEF